MPRGGAATRKRILDFGVEIVSSENLSSLCLENVSGKAGISKRAFYTHFPSKDHFLEALAEHQRPHHLDRYRTWAESCGPGAGIKQRIIRIITELCELSASPNFSGCCFTKMAAELGGMKGHPVNRIIAKAFQDTEEWLAAELAKEGYGDARGIAKQVCVLINGLQVVQLVSQSESHGAAVAKLVENIVADSPHALGD